VLGRGSNTSRDKSRGRNAGHGGDMHGRYDGPFCVNHT
jgi:hypothetical protein